MQRFVCCGLVLMAFILPACSGGGPPPIKNMVPTSKVTGTVTINGTPAYGVLVRCVPTSTIKETRPEYTGRFFSYTIDKGMFAMKTYGGSDGLPAGDYSMLFTYEYTTAAEREKFGDSDRFEGLFNDLKKPLKTIKVEEGKPLDLGTIDLTVPNFK